MTHFVTLHYFQVLAPPLCLLVAAALGTTKAARACLLVAAGLALCRLNLPPEEVFSRQLASDAIANGALVVIALASWRAPALPMFFFALVGAANDLLTLAVASALAAASLRATRVTALCLALPVALFAFTGAGEFSLALGRAPVPCFLLTAPVCMALWSIADWRAKAAAMALAARMASLAWAPYGTAWLLQ